MSRDLVLPFTVRFGVRHVVAASLLTLCGYGWSTAQIKMSENTVRGARREARERTSELVKEGQLVAAIEVLVWLDESTARHDLWRRQPKIWRLATLPPPETHMPHKIVDEHTDW